MIAITRGFLLCTLFYLVTNQVYSQTTMLKGYIRNIHEKSIAYVNIGIENKGVGCMSDSEGHFCLSVPDSLLYMALTASHISYEKYSRDINNASSG